MCAPMMIVQKLPYSMAGLGSIKEFLRFLWQQQIPLKWVIGGPTLVLQCQVSYKATTKALLGPLLELKSWSSVTITGTITHTCLTGVRMQQLTGMLSELT
ncbi:unnamed protein product [Calypogeia fissa]